MNRAKTSHVKRCPLCHQSIRKNGFTKTGLQRWRCDRCHYTCTKSRVNTRQRTEFDMFLTWLMGKASMSECAEQLGINRKTFQRRIAWCWDITPPIPHTKTISFIQIDGTWVPYGWCLLVCGDEHCNVLAWQWAAGETTSAYQALLKHVDHTQVVCTDGGTGALSAIKYTYPNARVQRCLVHVQRDGRRDLTLNPRTLAGKELRQLYLRLTTVHDLTAAMQWLVDLDTWHTKYRKFLTERTYATQDPTNPKALHGQTWWWTHLRVRRAYLRLERLNRTGMLFAFVNPKEEALQVTPTTNRLEGGINAGLKRLLDLHRGLSEEHTKRCAEWYCYMHTSDPDPKQVLDSYLKASKPVHKPQHELTDSDLFGTGIQNPGSNPENIDAYESGFGIRKGWIR